jgi:hypothetical protein
VGGKNAQNGIHKLYDNPVTQKLRRHSRDSGTFAYQDSIETKVCKDPKEGNVKNYERNPAEICHIEIVGEEKKDKKAD